ncbi:hypothetical protein Patl1_15718 [Pistacia atlantica]|uniref:Uncharacterized protein n=1 Tax=Pistacia atlantica TaxID=434234 RepID=A0ACC1BBK1_9ROSI|nr:hypothetical protein Patl1_15718 [Pistacia atlantica]
MASPTWLPQEVQPSSGGPSTGSSTAIASPASVSGGAATGSMREPAQVINSNPSASPVSFQPPITRSASSSEKGVEASIDGVLVGFGKVNDVDIKGKGHGFGKVNDVDIKGSEAFLQTLFFERFNNAARTQHLVALDCGSGIGRITKNILMSLENFLTKLLAGFVSFELYSAKESQSLYNSSSSTVAASSTSKVVPTSWMHTFSSFTVPPGLSGAPGTPGPLGLVSSPLKNASSAIMDSNTSAVWRPNVSTAPAPSNQAIQHPIYPTHPSLPPISGSSQGHWLQHPQTGVMLGRLFRHVPLFILLPFFCRHLACLIFLLHQMILYLLVFLLWQMLSSAASGQQVVGASGMQTEPPSGIGTLRVYAR